MARVALLGYGRMGKMIEAAAEQRGHEIVAKFDAGDAGRVLPKGAQVAIDFSLPHVASANCRRALEQGVPVVSGTTGWDVGALVNSFAGQTHAGFLHATNMSVGVNVVFAVNALLARALRGKGYRAALSETHHVHKLDAPSGTAVTLAEGTAAGLGTPPEVTSVREGEVIGLHVVDYGSRADAITLRHEAHDRTGFAHGAVLAAEYLLGKTGVHTMADVLGLTHLASLS